VQDQRQTVSNCSDHYKSKKGQWINTGKLSWYSTAAHYGAVCYLIYMIYANG
jgi:hypothetical protein